LASLLAATALIPHLRSIYIPFIADHVHGINLDPRELALQIVDIVALRPEVEVCYMGILNKCFEVLENKAREAYNTVRDSSSSPAHIGPGWVGTDASSAASDEMEDEDDGDDEDGEDSEGNVHAGDSDGTESEISSDAHDDSDEDYSFDVEGTSSARLKLREILFYDDKIAIFKARHGRL